MIADGTWDIDPERTVVVLRARAFGFPTACEMTVLEATATITDHGGTGALRARLDTTSFRSGNDRRDAHVKSADFLHADAHPVLTFDATWVGLAATPATVVGDVQLGDASVPAALSVTAEKRGDGEVRFRGSARVSRRQLGLKRARFILGDRIDVAVGGVAVRTGRSDARKVCHDEEFLSPPRTSDR